jgi:hypothetical protein
MTDKLAPYNHAVVWLDSREARLFRDTAEDVAKTRIRAAVKPALE